MWLNQNWRVALAAWIDFQCPAVPSDNIWRAAKVTGNFGVTENRFVRQASSNSIACIGTRTPTRDDTQSVLSCITVRQRVQVGREFCGSLERHAAWEWSFSTSPLHTTKLLRRGKKCSNLNIIPHTVVPIIGWNRKERTRECVFPLLRINGSSQTKIYLINRTPVYSPRDSYKYLAKYLSLHKMASNLNFHIKDINLS